MADTFCLSSSCFKTNVNLQLITYIILHDVSLLCSIIISYPLYFSYFIFFSRYLIKLFSFISPLFIITVFLSLILTTTTTSFCHNLTDPELGILQTVINELKLSKDEVNGYENGLTFEDFEIYKIVFDGTLVCDVGVEEMSLTMKKVIEHSVDRANCLDLNDEDADNDVDNDKLCVEKALDSYVNGGCRNDNAVNTCEKLGVEKLQDIFIHSGRRIDVNGSWRNDNAVNTCEKLGVEKLQDIFIQSGRRIDVNGSWRNDNAVNTCEKLGVEKLQDIFIQSGRRIDVNGSWRNDNAVNTCEKLGVEKLQDIFIHSGRRIDATVTNSYVEQLKNVEVMEKLIEELDRFEDFTTATESETDLDEVVGELGKADAGLVRRVVSYNGKESQNTVGLSSWRSNSSSNFKSHGLMKEEKEWRRTLACKLFEERYNSQGGEEGMDSLWEAYETDNEKNRNEMMSNNNDGGIESFNDVEEDEDVDDEGEEMSNGHLCCLQALKFSTRKMSLGMGRPNLMKISKALKGFGWLHQVKNKHGKTSLGSLMG